MATIKNGDFVEVEYTGKVIDDNFVFDTTSEKIAKELHIHNPYGLYGPAIVCIGQHQLLRGLEEELVGKEVGKEYTMKLAPEKAFGKKSTQLLKLVPLTAFKEGNTRPEVGMQVDVDGQMGIVKTVTGGRVVVDFNHPLSSKEVEYKIKVNKVVTDDAVKVKATITLTLNMRQDRVDVSVVNGKAVVKMIKLPEPFQKEFAKRIIDVVPTIKEVVFEEKKEEKAEKQPLNRSK